MDGWVRLFATEMRRATLAAEQLGASLRSLETDWMGRAHHPRARSVVNVAIHRLAELPVIDVASLARLLGVDPETARRGIGALDAAGIVRQVSKGRRNRVWVADEALSLLDGFDELLAGGPSGRRHPTRGARR